MALPCNQYSTTFSLDGAGSPVSTHGGRHMPATFKPTPLKSFTVVVSIVPADQVRQNSTTPPTSAGLAVEGPGGAAGVGGLPSMASSIPATAGAPSTPGFMLGPSTNPANSSFALTKSFGDVFALKKASGGSTGSGPLASSNRSNNSFDSTHGLTASSAAAAAAAAAVKGLADPSVSETPVANSQDSYRVHLLLPADYASTASATGPAKPSASLYGGDGLSAATAPLESLRTAKRKQAAQVNEHWMLFQQLVRFVLSVAPRFEPPPTPPGFEFPVDLGLSFVQNSSIFCAAEATQQGRGMASPLSSVASGGFSGGPASPTKTKADDPLVRGEEREARRAYMEAYLNAAVQCDQVNCLKELQSFVGYDTYVKNELAHFRTMSRTPSGSSIAAESPGTSLAAIAGPLRTRGEGSNSEFHHRGPLGSSAQSTSAHSHQTVSTTSSTSPKAENNNRRPPPTMARSSSSTGQTTPAAEAVKRTVAMAVSQVPSSRTSDVSSLPAAGIFSVSPPALARSLPPSVSPPLHPLEDLPHSSPFNTASPVMGGSGVLLAPPPPSSQSTTHHNGGVVDVIDFSGATASRAASTLSDGGHGSLQQPIPPPQPPFAKSGPRNGGGSSTGATSFTSVISGHVDLNGSVRSTDNVSASAALARPLATSASSGGSVRPLGRSDPQAGAAESSLLSAVEVRSRRGNDDGDEESGSSTGSSSSASSSFGSSVSHPRSAHQHGHQRHHRHHHHHQHRHHGSDNAEQHRSHRLRSREEKEKKGGADGDADGTATKHRHGSRDRKDEDGGTATAASTALPRSDMKSRVSIAPETERMLTECFRMMDTTGCGYVAAGDCLLFYLCATPDTFTEALHRYTNAASQTEDGNGQRIPSAAQLEALLPSWMRDCEGVVVGQPEYLMCCTRFVDAVREMLTVSAAMAITNNAAGVDYASSAQPPSKAQTRTGGDGVSGNGTPGSSAPSPGGLPVVLGSGRHTESTPPPQRTDAGDGSARGEEGKTASAAAAAPIASLEGWIDNYWLLLYSHLFTAIAALVVGEEAAGMRAALLEVREKAYLEMTAQVATAVRLRQAETPSLELVYPPWLLRDVAAALAAQPPILGCFDSLELLSLVYVISESGLSVVGVEEVLQWLGTRTCQPNTRFSLDEFASMLDALSCSLPFADVLHCVRRRWAATAADADGPTSLPQPPAHLLRLVSRCATADPAGGREFNDLVREQHWYRGGRGDGGDGRVCAQCQLARGVLEQQATLLETLTDENAKLQQRVAELETLAAATVPVAHAAAPANNDDAPNVPTSTATTATTATGVASTNERNPRTQLQSPTPEPTATATPAENDTASAGQQLLSSSPPVLNDGDQRSTDARVSLATSPVIGEAEGYAPSRATIELVPVFTAESDKADSADPADPRDARRSSRQSRAAVTQVARAGPLLYSVPSKYEQRRPREMEFSFYLCHTMPPEDDKRITVTGGNDSGSGGSATQATPLVERLTVRDGAGSRVVAFKLSGNVLQILGRDTEQRPSRLPLGTSPLSPKTQQQQQSPHPHHRLPHGVTTLSSALMHHGLNISERPSVNDVLGREQNILYPSYDDNGGDRTDNLYAFWHHSSGGGSGNNNNNNTVDGVMNVAPDRRDRPAWEATDAGATAAADATQPQRLVARVTLTARVWYTLRLRMHWEERTVDVTVSRTATDDGGATTAEEARRVYEGTVRMLDAADVSGLTSIEVFPRREMLVAYCNMLVRYEADHN